MTRKHLEVKEPRPTLKSVRAETARLFEDLIEFHIGIESALQTAASHERAAIDDHIDYLERKLFLEPEEYEPVQIGRAKKHYEKYSVLFPRLEWHAVLVLIVLVMERQMRRIGEALGTEMKKIKCALELLSERGYLPGGSPVLSDLIRLRDCVVHAAGHFAEMKNHKHLRDLLRSGWHGLKADDEGILVLDARFCMWAAQESRKVIMSVLEKAIVDEARVL
jgi:hypothetical protein